jgi:hypothetical protein
VTAILANPRYTGRQVWNRYATTSLSTRGPDTTNSRGRGSGAGRWNSASDWIISTKPAHPALVDDAGFLDVQRINAAHDPTRTYRLSGLVVCQMCGRRMEGAWAHGNAAYRCRHGYTTGTPRLDGIRNSYCREEQLLDALPRLLRDNGVPPDDTDADQPATDNTEQLIDLLPAHNLVITYGDNGTQLAHAAANTRPTTAG